MKARLGSERLKRSLFNFCHDINTTNSWGVCQPIITKELVADSSFDIRVGNVVRLAPLVKPTFGAGEVKTYLGFVPYAEIFHPYEAFQAGKPYQGISSYVPESVPHLPIGVLRHYALLFANVSVFRVENYYTENNRAFFFNPFWLYDPSDARNIYQQVIESQYRLFPEYTNYLRRDCLTAIQANYLRFNHLEDVPPAIESFDHMLFGTVGNDTYLIGFRFSRRGLQLRNLILGCGAQICHSFKEFNFLNMVAHFKFYFDTLVPERNVTWKQTKVYGLIEYVEQTNTNITASDRFMLALSEMTDMYYYTGSDFISAHITGTSIQDNVNNVSVYGADDSTISVGNVNGLQPSLDTSLVSSVSRAALLALNKLSTYVNKNTALGGSLRDFMRVHFGAAYLNEDKSYYIGTSITDIEISDVMSTSDTLSASGDTGSVIGEYAGRGIGRSHGEKFHFETNAPGVVVGFQVIVPRTHWVQGIDPNVSHVHRFDFHHGQFDAITLRANSKDVLFGTQDVYTPGLDRNFDAGFGNIPLYTEYKICPSKALGELSLRSTRDSYMPFTMDKLLPYDHTSFFKSEGNTEYIIDVMPMSEIVNSVEWRSIGKYPWMGNFDRIFENSGNEDQYDLRYYQDFEKLNDNFIIHNIVDFVCHAPMIPVDSSFDTDAFDEKTLTVEKQ